MSDFADLAGRGGELNIGRWHVIGRPIVYAAESSALAMLEILVNFGVPHVPATFQLLRIEGPDMAMARYDATRTPDIAVSRAWGDAWLASGASVIADVPSAVAPYSRNLLLNPHRAAAAGFRIAEASRWPWDSRLFR